MSFAACRDITFSVDKGEIVAFLGPNGAGKSTTMKLLTGYLAPSEGVARIAGHDMSTDRLAGSARLGYLPENGPLYPDMTPASLLAFFAEARGLGKQQAKERIDAVADICALASVFHKPISKLSKGFRQRVGMAQALLHEPDVLIMDEPTAGLDPNQIQEVRHTMQRLGAEANHPALDPHPAGGGGPGQPRDYGQRGAACRRRPAGRIHWGWQESRQEFQRLTTAAAT